MESNSCSIRISDCSENITDASGDKKEQYYQSNIESEIHNIKLKPNIFRNTFFRK